MLSLFDLCTSAKQLGSPGVSFVVSYCVTQRKGHARDHLPAAIGKNYPRVDSSAGESTARASQAGRGKILVKRSHLDAWLEAHPYQPIDSINVDQVADEIIDQFRKAA